jgi:hypothetical protein
MTPNIDIVNDFAELQKKNKELSDSNILLANRVMQMHSDIERLIQWCEAFKTSPAETMIALVPEKLQEILNKKL